MNNRFYKRYADVHSYTMLQPISLVLTICILLWLMLIRWVQSPKWLGVGWSLLQMHALFQVGNACLGLGFGADRLGSLMLLMISFLVVIIARFAKIYLHRDPRETVSLRWFLGVWLCASQIAVAQNLLVLALAWTGTSLCLHGLIAQDRQRPAGVQAANRKWRIARLADLALYASLALLWQELGTLEIEKLQPLLAMHQSLSTGLQIATVFLAVVAILKSGQLPFHGWLIAVMEAPTPVSALLHAGAINIAGFVLIRVAPLLSLSEPAQILLVGWGGATALMAGIVATTRPSIKSALAWSTSAQMGFMLLECGLGAYSLAMLHLLAHSFYKAHSFLNAADTVWNTRRRQLSGPTSLPEGDQAWLGALGLCLIVAVTAPAYAVWVVAMTPLWLLAQGNVRWLLAGFFLVTLYYLQHNLLLVLVPSSPPCRLALSLAVLFLMTLFVVNRCILRYPRGVLARWLYPRALAGFHLDEWFQSWFDAQPGGKCEKLA
jgi:NAD(P)H-quinone oxidoreductase subunit 5